jgi:anti-sigma factor RsiW
MDPDKQTEMDQALKEVLERKLPRYATPLHLKQRLAAQWPQVHADRARWLPRFSSLALAASIAIVVGGATVFLGGREASWRQLSGEAVNDHLRVLEGAPLAQVTGGLHEVKPWFGGKLDFAPAVAFAGDEAFPLQGGAVEEFLDRRAAVFVYKRRLHTASLFVIDAQGRGFPSSRTETVRGFNVVLWKEGGQGYALVSDLNLGELLDLKKRLVAASAARQ